jgi:glyoxylase-like metal-dependent hydrolase (beta-lactamase superfamily II)
MIIDLGCWSALTHAHADHAEGLAAGARCPVYATKETWDLIHRFPITSRANASRSARTPQGALTIARALTAPEAS